MFTPHKGYCDIIDIIDAILLVSIIVMIAIIMHVRRCISEMSGPCRTS